MLKLLELRKEKNLSQRALASKIGCSQKAVDYWEKGITEPTAGYIVKLADYFACSVDYFLGREDDYGNINVNSDLSEEEKNVLFIYGGLNVSEREEWLRYGSYLRFKKDGKF